MSLPPAQDGEGQIVKQVRAERLRTRADFERVFSGGRSLPMRLLVLRVVAGRACCTRVGIAVGKQLGGAIVRNRVRRRWREVVRRGPPLTGAWDVVLVARAACREADWAALTGAWREALQRAGLVGSDSRG